MNHSNRQHINLWLLLSAFWLCVTGGLAFVGLKLTEDAFTYPLDDTYIHLAIAESLQETGNWGPSPFQFQFSSSSPAYTLLLSFASGFVPDSIYVPLILNGLIALLWIWLISGIASTFLEVRFIWKFLILAGITFLVPLHLLTLLGMEHMAQLFFSTWFLREASRKLEKPDTHPNGLLILSGILMSFFRYESLFLLGGFVLVGLWKKKWKTSLFTAFCCTLPLLLFGMYMLSRGGTFLPISVMGKAHGVDLIEGNFSAWMLKGVQNLYDSPFILVLLLANLGLLLFQIGPRLEMWIKIWLMATGFHILFAEIGGYRYEAYLVGLGLLSFVHFKIPKIDLPLFTVGQKQAIIILFCLALFPLGLRSLFFTVNYPIFCQNIYQQPIQVGKFLQNHYPEASVGLNDIGAGSYFGTIELTDLVGIGDQRVYELRKSNEYSPTTIQQLAEERGMKIAIAHPIWIGNIVPDSWTKVGEMTIPHNMICADQTIAFYACKPSETAVLKEKLNAFQDQLPTAVKLELFVE